MSLSRRDFFRFAWRAPDAEPCSTAQGIAFLRPPGALPEADFLGACTRCDACLIACPRESIRRAGHELGDANEGTPVILPTEQPCWMCEGMPCIPACEPGALRPLAAPSDARMGTVAIRDEACYSASGNICDTCAERCPVRPKAIGVSMGEAPRLDPELCTGCAVCAWLCPAGAIDVIPS